MKKILFILLLYSPFLTYSQNLSFEYSVGYGTYQLEDIRNLQNSMVNYLGLKITDCFPNYVTHTAALGLVSDQNYLGTNFSYLTTGGRLHRADYSGSYTADIIMNGYRLGAFYRYSFNTGFSPLNFYLQISPGFLFSKLRMTEQLTVYSESIEEINELSGLGLYLEPSIGVTYRFTNWLHLSLGAGYEADLFGTLYLSNQETNIKANWNGFRFYGGLNFIIPTFK